MKRPKLFYVPGMISLLVVPVLFYVYQPVQKKQTILKFVLPNEDNAYTSVKAHLKGKKINKVYYDDDHDLNAQKLEFIGQEALKLKFYYDTMQVIKVRLSDETTYNEFVQLVNVMYKNKQKRYTWLDNDFYILGDRPPEPEVTYFICGTVPLLVEYHHSPGFWQQVNKYISLIINNVWLLSAFVLLIAVPAIIKRKRGY